MLGSTLSGCWRRSRTRRGTLSARVLLLCLQQLCVMVAVCEGRSQGFSRGPRWLRRLLAELEGRHECYMLYIYIAPRRRRGHLARPCRRHAGGGDQRIISGCHSRVRDLASKTLFCPGRTQPVASKAGSRPGFGPWTPRVEQEDNETCKKLWRRWGLLLDHPFTQNNLM